MEQRRIIGYILLALAAVICLASNVWFIVKMPMGGEKVSHLIFRTLPEVLALLTVVYIFVHQGKSMNLKLDIRERRLKLDESHALPLTSWINLVYPCSTGFPLDGVSLY